MSARTRAAVLMLAAAAVLGVAGTARAGGGCQEEDATSGNGSAIVYEGGCVGPNVLNVKTGQTITWTNKDDTPHTVTSGSGRWASNTLEAGQTFSHTFMKAGMYPFYCQIHPNMGGVVMVGLGRPTSAAATSNDTTKQSGGWLALASGLGLVVGGAAVSARRRLFKQKEGAA